MRFQDSRPDHWAPDDPYAAMARKLWGPTELIDDRPTPPRGLYPVAVWAIVLALAAVFLFMAVVATHAHDWYPMECCSAQDCAPVDKAESSMPPMSVPDLPPGASGFLPMAPAPGVPTLNVTTRHGTATVPPDITRRPSPDGRMHACIHWGRVICIFVPPGS